MTTDKPKDGGPAFPTEFGAHVSREGMTLRDYAEVAFTAAWIQTLGLRYDERGYTDSGAVAEAHRLGVSQADAMIAAREGR